VKGLSTVTAFFGQPPLSAWKERMFSVVRRPSSPTNHASGFFRKSFALFSAP